MQKYFLPLVFLFFIGFNPNLIAQDLPEHLSGVYELQADPSYSDEFNGKRENNAFDTEKWHYRKGTKQRPGLGQGEMFVQEKNGKLICYGVKSLRKGGSIVSNKYFQYGFYAFKWRAKGMPHDKRNAWHPSVWGSFSDTKGSRVPYTAARGSSWMEIDIMEFMNHSKNKTVWSADAPAYIWVDTLMRKVKVNKGLGPKFGWKKAIMTDGIKTSYKGEIIGAKKHHKWTTLGMEYNPKYLQLWKKDGKKWVMIGHRITFSDNNIKPSKSTVPIKAAKPLYWIIGNLFFPSGKTPIVEAEISDSRFEVDWFRYHQLVKRY